MIIWNRNLKKNIQAKNSEKVNSEIKKRKERRERNLESRQK